MNWLLWAQASDGDLRLLHWWAARSAESEYRRFRRPKWAHPLRAVLRTVFQAGRLGTRLRDGLRQLHGDRGRAYAEINRMNPSFGPITWSTPSRSACRLPGRESGGDNVSIGLCPVFTSAEAVVTDSGLNPRSPQVQK